MIAIVTMVLPLVLKLLGMLLDKYVESAEAKELFIKMVGSLEYGGLKSVKLNQSYREQIEAHKAKKAQISQR